MMERTIRTTAVSAKETVGTLSFLLNTRARLATSIYAITFTTRSHLLLNNLINLIEELGPHIGLVIKCEVFSPQGNHLFPPAVKSSLSPNLEILGVPIGDY